jgi:hypothetical protein
MAATAVSEMAASAVVMAMVAETAVAMVATVAAAVTAVTAAKPWLRHSCLPGRDSLRSVSRPGRFSFSRGEQ